MLCFVATLCSLCVILLIPSVLPASFKVGGVFNQGEEAIENAFIEAVEQFNGKRGNRLIRSIERLPQKSDSRDAQRAACSLMQSGVAGIFGPNEPELANHVQSVCDAMDIPHVQLLWDNWEAFDRTPQSINLHPHPAVLGQAYEALIESWNWEKFALLYEDFEGFIGLQTLLRPNSPDNNRRSFIIRQLPDNNNYRPLLRELKGLRHFRMILDCDASKLYKILEQAQQIGMMTEEYSYVATTLDLHTVDLERFQYGGANITGFRLVNLDNGTVWQVMNEWQQRIDREGLGSEQCPPDAVNKKKNRTVPVEIKTEAALMYDAVHVFANALGKLGSSQVINTKSINCEGDNFWEHGHSLINYMKLEEVEGLTGKIVFDSQGMRTYFKLDVMKLTELGLVKAGVWTPNQINYFSINHTATKLETTALFNKTMIVTTILSDPYTMFRISSEELFGNDRFEGFTMDLIKAVSEKLHFNYTFKLADDGYHGSFVKDPSHPQGGYWNGMISEVINGVADMAIADLTISYERESVVDFTTPWMNLGISILYRKPTKQPPNLFSFLSPLSPDVWIYMASAYLFVSVVLFLLARFTPYEWVNPYACIDDPDELENDLTLSNSLWHNWGSLMQQGSDIAPKAVSTRMVAGMWWFFTLIMISSYTANLAAFLTVEQLESPIGSAADLANQDKIKYGCLAGGSTFSFFRDANVSVYQKMYKYMNSHEEHMVKKNTHGVERVEESNGGYAFLMESTSIEYVVERRCKLAQVGGLLDTKGYGIALAPNSPYRGLINGAILELREDGVLHNLKTKWWKQKRGAGKCKETSSSGGQAAPLGLPNVGGVFVVLIGGMGIACLIAAVEFFWGSRSVAKEEGVSIWSEMKKELKFAMKCSGSTKPVKRKEEEEDEQEEDVDDVPIERNANK